MYMAPILVFKYIGFSRNDCSFNSPFFGGSLFPHFVCFYKVKLAVLFVLTTLWRWRPILENMGCDLYKRVPKY